jgi:PPIC-type PPIASE domain
MNTQLRIFSMAVAALLAAAPLTRVATADDVNGLSLTPPGPAAADASPSIVLAPVRANVALTTDGLLGFVNSQPVFVQDMFRPIDKELRGIAASAHNITEFRDAARTAVEQQMRSYVYEMVVFSTANAALSDQEKAGLDHYMATLRSQLLSKHGGSVAMADEFYKASGSSVDKELDDERRKLIVQVYMQKQISPRIVITRDMVMDQYQRSAAMKEDAEIELFTITLPVKRWLREPGVGGKKGPYMENPTGAQILQAEQMALETGREIAAKAKAGADFAVLAEDYNSDDDRKKYGGYWPKVKHDDGLNPKIENYAFSLPANTVGDPLLLANDDFQKLAVVVMKVGKKKEARVVPFSEAQKAIRASIYDKQFQELQTQYMDKLSKGAVIEAVERMTDVALEAAITRYATQ